MVVSEKYFYSCFGQKILTEFLTFFSLSALCWSLVIIVRCGQSINLQLTGQLKENTVKSFIVRRLYFAKKLWDYPGLTDINGGNLPSNYTKRPGHRTARTLVDVTNIIVLIPGKLRDWGFLFCCLFWINLCRFECIWMYSLTSNWYLPPATKLGQGYVFTLVCDSVHGGWGCLSQCMLMIPPWEQTPPGADTAPGADTPREQTTPRAVYVGRYGQQAGCTHPTGMHTCSTLS